MEIEKIKNMTNLTGDEQTDFVTDWAEYAKLTLYEMGVSNKYINSENSSYIIAKIVTDLVEDGELSSTTNAMIATLRVNHPHSEDNENV